MVEGDDSAVASDRYGRDATQRPSGLGGAAPAQGWPSTLESRWTHVGGRRVHALSTRTHDASRPPVVVVHGLVVASRSVAPMLEAFTRLGVEACAPDLPGFGLSDKPDRALGVDALAAELAAWLDAEGVGPAYVLGNSFGSQIAAALVAREPARAAGLVLLAPTLEPGMRRRAQRVLAPVCRLAARPLTTRAPRVAVACRALSGAAARTLLRLPRRPEGPPPGLATVTALEWPCAGLVRAAATVAHCLDDAIDARLGSIEVPTLVLRAERDHVTRPEWVRAAVDVLTHGHADTLEGLGHSAQFRGGAQIAARVVAFIGAGPTTAP